MANAIGKLQSKFTVYCTICTQPITRGRLQLGVVAYR